MNDWTASQMAIGMAVHQIFSSLDELRSELPRISSHDLSELAAAASQIADVIVQARNAKRVQK